jgi:hypothetical protein
VPAPGRLVPVLMLLPLFACGGGGGEPDGGGGGLITVSGRVLAGSVPVPGVLIAIGGQSTHTDASGRFRIPNVSVPYDLIEVVPTGLGAAAVYQGLTRPDPTVLAVGSWPTLHSGTVTGTISGGEAVGSPGVNTVVGWGSAESDPATGAVLNPYALDVYWRGPNAITGTVHALQWKTDSQGLTIFTGHGARQGVQLVSASDARADLLMTPLTTSRIGGTLSYPPDYHSYGLHLGVAFPDGALIDVASGGETSPFNLAFPELADASAKLQVRAQGPHGALSDVVLSNIRPGTHDLSLEFRAAQDLLSPDDYASGVDTSTEFSWTPFDGGVTVFYAYDWSSGPEYLVITAGTKAHLPDLSPYGVALPSRVRLTWNAIGVGPLPSVDALATGGSVLPAQDVVLDTISPYRTFTTR